jgi:predicted flap endonuclease-1-like 5' DNA nuclease
MLEIASQMILCLLLAALLGFIIGYLFGKGTCADDNCGQDDNIHQDKVNHTQSAQGLTSSVASESTSSSHKLQASSNHSATDTTASIAENTTKHSEPKMLTSARNGKADNLTRIKGVGDKIEEELNNTGIYHFDQIANWNTQNIAWADETLGFPGRVAREEWVPQAKILASGGESEFSKRVDAGEVASSSTNIEPERLTAPRNGGKDNLTRIKGIGLKIEEALNAVGIYHFDQISKWGAEHIEWADETLGFPGRANREKWVSQAIALASGEETEFSKRVDAGEVSTSKQD